MNTFNQFSDSQPQNSSSSDAGSGGGSVAAYEPAHSNEEVLLATSRPKRRAGRRVFKETRHPVYRGVRQRNKGKWVCELREPKKKTRIWLGTYPTPEMAARAHDVAALALRGKGACLNFADSVWRLPVPSSTDSADIRRAAAEAAETFRPEEAGEEREEKVCGLTAEKVQFVDEEAVFYMPRLLVSMAEGLLLSPPPRDCWDCDDTESGIAISLWSY